MPLALLVVPVIFFGLMGVIFYFGHRFYAKPHQIYEQISTDASFEQRLPKQAAEEAKPGLLVRLFQNVGNKVASRQKDLSALQERLIHAGYRSKGALHVFYGIRVAAGCVFLMAGVVFQDHLPLADRNPMFGVLGLALIGYLAPNFVLKFKVKARQKIIRLSLPDALDLLVVCVEAGLGLDQAMANVATELRATHPLISQELGLVNLEMRAGTRRTEALRGLASRTGVDDVRKLVAVLIQADRFGTSIGESLRNHSEFMRMKRRQKAEEQANKVAVKLVFPIFFCIMPSIVLVAAGPAMIRVFKTLLPMMRKMGA